MAAYIDFGERMDYGATQTHCDKQWTIPQLTKILISTSLDKNFITA
jgi:hypothetical protein